MKTDINLTSGVLVESASKSKSLKILRIAAFISIIFTAAASILLFFLINQISPSNIKKQEDKVLLSIKFLRDKQAKIAIINSKIADISKILNSRINYESEMNLLLEKIPNGVLVNSLGIDKTKVTITVSSNSLSSIDKMLNSFFEMIAKKQLINSITIQNISSDPISSTYSLSAKANKL